MVIIIQIYKQDNTDYNKNGDMVLMPTEALVYAEINGVWSFTLKHPIDNERRWEYILPNAVIKCPSFMQSEQLYRIRTVKITDGGIEATAEPIFMDARNEVFITKTVLENKNGQEALDEIFAKQNKYSGFSNIIDRYTAEYDCKNGIEVIASEEENSFLNRWGGEILFDNYNVIIDKRVGNDYGVELIYGKNISTDGLEEEIDFSDIITRIYPKAYNKIEYLRNGKKFVDSSLINSYPIVYNASVSYENIKMAEDANEDDFNNPEIIVCQTTDELMDALENAANTDFSMGIDRPKVTIDVDMVLLKDTVLYEEYSVLENVSLGDVVHCKHSKLNIVTEARVIALEYNVVKATVTGVTLGDFQYNYFNDVTRGINTATKRVEDVSNTLNSATSKIDGVINLDGSIKAEKLKGLIDGSKVNLKAQYNEHEKANVQTILFENFDKTSSNYGALAMGTQGLMFSKQRTSNDDDWNWTTAIDSNGITASVLKGLISSDDSYWDLDTGNVNLKGSFIINGGNINIDSQDDMTNYLKLQGNSIFNHLLVSTMAPGQHIIENKTLNGMTKLQAHKLDITFPLSNVYMSVDPQTGENPVFYLEDKKEGLITKIDKDGICIQGENGKSMIQPGRFMCFNNEGNITFDSNNANNK